jgi:peptidoglycan/LPS O-acetylase OafA/YrhL
MPDRVEAEAAPDRRAAGGSPALLSIQVLRAVAALGVLVHHLPNELATRLGWPGALPPFLVGASGVDLFFVISGFVMVYASERLFGHPDAPRVFVLRRLARIVPLYWAASAVLLVYMLGVHRGLPVDVSVGTVVASFAFLPYARPDGLVAPIHLLGWTLNYEMFFYAVFAAAIRLSRPRAVLAVLAAFAVMVGLGCAVALPLPWAAWFDPIILEFGAGMLIAVACRAGLRLSRAAAVGLGLAAVAGYAVASWAELSEPWRAVERGLPGAALVAACVLCGAPPRPGPVARGVAFLGDASYSLYLVHPLVFALPRWTVARWIDFSPVPLAYALVLMAVSVLAAILSYLVFEKPLSRALKTRLGGPRPPSRREARGVLAREAAVPGASSPLGERPPMACQGL